MKHFLTFLLLAVLTATQAQTFNFSDTFNSRKDFLGSEHISTTFEINDCYITQKGAEEKHFIIKDVMAEKEDGLYSIKAYRCQQGGKIYLVQTTHLDGVLVSVGVANGDVKTDYYNKN